MWREVQDIYMPGAHILRSITSSSTSSMQPEATKLLLPSALSNTQWTLGIIPGLEKEAWLQIVQADYALHELRRQLRVSVQLLDFKKNTVGSTSQ